MELDETRKLGELKLRLPQQYALQLVVAVDNVLVVWVLQKLEEISCKIRLKSRRN